MAKISEDQHQRQIEFELSLKEEEQTNYALGLMMLGLTHLLKGKVPMLAIAVAAAEVFAEAGVKLMEADQSTNHTTVNGREALRDLLRIIGLYFDKTATIIDKHGELGEIPPFKGPVH